MRLWLSKNRPLFLINGTAYRPFGWEMGRGTEPDYTAPYSPDRIIYSGNDHLIMSFRDRTVTVSCDLSRHPGHADTRPSGRMIVTINHATITVQGKWGPTTTRSFTTEQVQVLRHAAKLALRSIQDHRDNLEAHWEASGRISIYQEDMMRLGMPIALQKQALEILKDA